MILWNRPRIYDVDAVGALAVFGVLLAGVMLVLHPMGRRADSLPQWERTCENAGQELLAARKTEHQLREGFASLQAAMETDDRVLLSRRELDKYLEQVAELCRRYGVEVDEVRPGAAQSLSACVVCTVEYKARAELQGLVALLADLENTTQFLDVYQLSVQNRQPAAAGPYQVEWTMRVFFSPEPDGEQLADARGSR